MKLFNTIFETVNIHNNNNTLATYFYFFSNSNLTYNQYTRKQQIFYKYFIFKNFYFNSHFNDSSKKDILELFYQTQKIFMALYKFKYLFILKFKKYKGEQLDLNFNILKETHKYNITLIENNNKILFNIFDLIKIICTSLSYECNFFAEPKHVKNPWNNSSFSLSNLYNIYFFIKYSSIEMPILFLRYFQSSFCLKKFKDENQFIIKQYIIDNYKNFDTNNKIIYIHKMLDFYNNLAIKNDQIIIDTLFPKEKLLSIFEKFIKIFLLSKFSYESDIRIKNKFKLKHMLKNFKQMQPLFGRRIVTIYIKKLYSISELKYKYNHVFFTNLYIPPKDLIFLNNKSFFIDYNYNMDNNYSIFPSLECKHVQTPLPYNITNLTLFVKSVKFTEEQKHIIQNEFKPIFDNIEFVNYNCICHENSENHHNIESFLQILSNNNIDISNSDQTISNIDISNSDQTISNIDISNSEQTISNIDISNSYNEEAPIENLIENLIQHFDNLQMNDTDTDTDTDINNYTDIDNDNNTEYDNNTDTDYDIDNTMDYYDSDE